MNNKTAEESEAFHNKYSTTPELSKASYLAGWEAHAEWQASREVVWPTDSEIEKAALKCSLKETNMQLKALKKGFVNGISWLKSKLPEGPKLNK
jgi:hypothetical protein